MKQHQVRSSPIVPGPALASGLAQWQMNHAVRGAGYEPPCARDLERGSLVNDYLWGFPSAAVVQRSMGLRKSWPKYPVRLAAQRDSADEGAPFLFCEIHASPRNPAANATRLSRHLSGHTCGSRAMS